jgi:hypothetical protein
VVTVTATSTDQLFNAVNTDPLLWGPFAVGANPAGFVAGVVYGGFIDFSGAKEPEIEQALGAALGATGDGVREEVDVAQPHDAFPAEHGNRLDGIAETIHSALHLADIRREPVDDFAGKLIRHLGRERLETLLPCAADQKVVRAADEGEVFRRHARGGFGFRVLSF